MRRYAALIVVLFALLWTGLAAAQTANAAFVPYVYRIKIDGCTFEPVARRQTGFQVQGQVGIVTALHGVADCQTVSAVSDDGITIFTDLVIATVDIDRDMALLTSPTLTELPTDGLAPSTLSNPEILTATLRIVGYPLGLDQQDVDAVANVRDIESLDDVIPDPEEPADFIKRKSPALTIDVLNVQAQLLPGHSGAPVLDHENHVVAVGNGGLRGGTVGRSWAIPWQTIEWESVDVPTVKTKLAELATKDIAALAFSSTYPSQVGLGPSVQPNPSTCNKEWDCRLGKIEDLLYDKTSNANLCDFNFLILDTATEQPIRRASVTVMLADKRVIDETLGDGSSAARIPCNDNNPTVEVHVNANGYEPDSRRVMLIGNIETIYLTRSSQPTEIPSPTEKPSAATLPTQTQAYPCEAKTFSTGGATMISLRSSPAGGVQDSISVGVIVQVIRKLEEENLYSIWNEEQKIGGWISAEKLILANSCPK